MPTTVAQVSLVCPMVPEVVTFMRQISTRPLRLQSKGGYKELLFYLEACESGSIFNNLLKAPNAFAVTAANPHESSWGFYCPPSDSVNGKEINSCLGDEFSIN